MQRGVWCIQWCVVVGMLWSVYPPLPLPPLPSPPHLGLLLPLRCRCGGVLVWERQLLLGWQDILPTLREYTTIKATLFGNSCNGDGHYDRAKSHLAAGFSSGSGPGVGSSTTVKNGISPRHDTSLTSGGASAVSGEEAQSWEQPRDDAHTAAITRTLKHNYDWAEYKRALVEHIRSRRTTRPTVEPAQPSTRPGASGVAADDLGGHMAKATASRSSATVTAQAHARVLAKANAHPGAGGGTDARGSRRRGGHVNVVDSARGLVLNGAAGLGQAASAPKGSASARAAASPNAGARQRRAAAAKKAAARASADDDADDDDDDEPDGPTGAYFTPAAVEESPNPGGHLTLAARAGEGNLRFVANGGSGHHTAAHPHQ